MFKNLLLISLALSAFSFEAFAASSIVINASGRATDYCNANSGNYCFDKVKRDSQAEGVREAAWKCELQHRGRPQRFNPSHSTFCNPYSLPPGHKGTYVTCNTNTSMRCDLPN